MKQEALAPIKLYFFAIAALAFAACQAPSSPGNNNTNGNDNNTEDPGIDADFGNEDFGDILVDQGYDTNGDGKISEEEAGAVKDIEFGDGNGAIDDLSDISNLPNLESIIADWKDPANYPSSLDVSANPKLRTLWITRPAAGYEEGRIDVVIGEKNTELREFGFIVEKSGNGKLHSAIIQGLEHAVNLEKLRIDYVWFIQSQTDSGEKTMQIDPTAWPNLKSLTLNQSDDSDVFFNSQNKSYTLDLSQNSELEEINLLNFPSSSKDLTFYVHKNVLDNIDSIVNQTNVNRVIKFIEKPAR